MAFAAAARSIIIPRFGACPAQRDRESESIEQLGPSPGAERLARGESGVELVVVLDALLAVSPAEPHDATFDATVEVDEPRARVLHHGAERLHFLPAGVVRLDV